ncbi:MAG: cupredoxin domain-containing protein [Gammaproteobacteria bacterium]|nr:cupredoxin domain-containing protein [Gammaproteobacteria bacterium]MDH5592814.1 cupredoxin domain-containing protein [Gammaproteobacteria bacterium]MDH5614849.1 cupredoxin domain-containing protein [Gammaproteobacteria bacterium]
MKILLMISIFTLHLIIASSAQSELSVAKINESGIQVITIDSDSYSFTPDHVIVKAGVPVIFNVINLSGFVPHDLIIDDPESGLNIEQSLDDVTTIEFTPMKKGKFAFYCGKKLLFFESHREKGMHGILEVR